MVYRKSNYKFKKISYLRDCSNLKTKDGHRVCRGKLFRSCNFSKVSEYQSIKFQQFINLATIVDLRSNDEINEYPDNYSNGVNYYHLPALSSEDNPSINRQNRKAELIKLMACEGGTKAHLCEIYRKLASSDLAIENYRQFIRACIDTEGAVVWHCQQGKDRTGMATAILLSILGVDRKDIIKDYLYFNKARRLRNIGIFIGVGFLLLRMRMAIALNNLLAAKRCYILAFFDEIDKVFGSFNNYVHNALLLSDADIQKLKNMYLV